MFLRLQLFKDLKLPECIRLIFMMHLNGFAIGGDYTKPNNQHSNKIRTNDGGRTWEVVAQDQNPGYRSCVQYVPNSNAMGLVAVGFEGVDYSSDAWEYLETP